MVNYRPPTNNKLVAEFQAMAQKLADRYIYKREALQYFHSWSDAWRVEAEKIKLQPYEIPTKFGHIECSIIQPIRLMNDLLSRQNRGQGLDKITVRSIFRKIDDPNPPTCFSEYVLLHIIQEYISKLGGKNFTQRPDVLSIRRDLADSHEIIDMVDSGHAHWSYPPEVATWVENGCPGEEQVSAPRTPAHVIIASRNTSPVASEPGDNKVHGTLYSRAYGPLTAPTRS